MIDCHGSQHVVLKITIAKDRDWATPPPPLQMHARWAVRPPNVVERAQMFLFMQDNAVLTRELQTLEDTAGCDYRGI